MSESAEGPTGEMPEDVDEADGDDPSEAWRPPAPTRATSAAGEYKSFTQRFDETIAAEDLCDADERRGCAPISTSSSAICRAWWRRLANRLQRRLMAQKQGLGVRPRGRHARSVRLPRIVIDPYQPLSFKRERTPISAIRW